MSKAGKGFREFCIVEHRPDNFSSLDHYRCWLRPKDSHEASSTIIVIEKSALEAEQLRSAKLKKQIDVLCDGLKISKDNTERAKERLAVAVDNVDSEG